MSEQRRREIVDQMVADLGRPDLGFTTKGQRNFLQSSGGRGQSYWSSWHFFAVGYQRAFDVLWDAAYAHRPPLRIDCYPLLFVCRQSIELWLKAAISTVKQAKPPGHHKLSDLWTRLWAALSEHTGHPQLDESNDPNPYNSYVESVNDLIQILDAHDEKGDRFRYPTARGGDPYPTTGVDLDGLYRAHELITGFCDGVLTRMEVERDS
ncbi:MAG: hypothetical protein F4Z45_07610 [Gammaproteobacteria bacterium]|nr:hypothetical protein [Gammaproteobacteria bacterium]